MCIYEIKDKDCPNKSIWLSVKKKTVDKSKGIVVYIRTQRNSGEVTVLFLTCHHTSAFVSIISQRHDVMTCPNKVSEC